jgi:hypothetical protein
MKNSCYNIGTKRKKQTKNVSGFQKYGDKTDGQIESPKGVRQSAVGIRRKKK